MRVERARLAVAAALIVFTASTHAVVRGGVQVIALPDGTVSATFEERPVLIVEQPEPTAIVGIALDAALGRHVLVVQSGGDARAEIPFKVTDKAYPVQRLTLTDDKMVNPPPDELARIERETILQNAQYVTLHPARCIAVSDAAAGSGPRQFQLRTAPHSERTTPQPARRSRHRGAHRRPGAAPAAGTISFTGSLYFNGNAIFIDHGGGLISMLCHLSKIDVQAGDAVRKSQQIGLVGATGRATGPHLHWSVSLNGARVDPSAVLALYRPKPKTDKPAQ